MIWRQSSRTGNGDCVEVAFDGASVFVRDSKDRRGAVLVISGEQWLHLRRSIRRRYG
ncbi:DUF397 domain-containing protein [Actinomadura madurae]|uniref:DUF397 domain-containing protein n=1 Tax=Actinomadura madurae TaxID=1993 RepID=UPI000DD0776B|nr:DUF397 domain-containing protein [Actinomadura madurae]